MFKFVKIINMINKVILLGNLGKDPEKKGEVVKFPLATTETWNDKTGEKKKATEWHIVVCFGSLADVVEKFMKKGQLVYVEGRIKTSQWEKEGKKQYITEIIADTIRMIGNKTGKKNDESNEISNELPF
jgi:single-strand DNA-binding protein